MPIYFSDDRFYTKEELDDLLLQKADKVANAVVDNFVSLNAEGNILDSGLDIFDVLFQGVVDGGTY